MSDPGRSVVERWRLTDRIGVKVPELTIYFWVIKLLTTAMGEATSDFLVNHANPPLAVVVGFIFFAAALVWQLSREEYAPQVYWSVALMVSIFGTMAADAVHVALGVPYAVSAVGLAIALALVFWFWDRTEHTLSIHSVETRRRELFYWAAAVVTFALGTAMGDLTAVTFHLGFFSSGLLFAGVFALPALYFAATRRHGIFCFWFAYIATRPLGASFADWAAKPKSSGGLGAGDGIVAAVLGLLILVGVVYLALTGVDRPGAAATTRPTFAELGLDLGDEPLA